jgi:hypothetical protein
MKGNLMFKKLKSTAIVLTSLLTMAAPLAIPAAVGAAGNAVNISSGLCTGSDFNIFGGGGNCAGNTSGNQINDLLHQVVNIASAIVGVVAVVMIIVGGLRYVTSGGDSSKVSSAKSTLIYAIIGLIIVALAQIVVHFVLNQSATVTSP